DRPGESRCAVCSAPARTGRMRGLEPMVISRVAVSRRPQQAEAPPAGEGLRVLVIDDEVFHAETGAGSLERVGVECVIATSGRAGAERLEEGDFDVVLTDLRMNDLDGLAILRKARQVTPEAEVVVITGHGDVKTAVEAIKQGAANYLTKPVDLEELRAIVARAGERARLGRTNRELQRQLAGKVGFEGGVGPTPV